MSKNNKRINSITEAVGDTSGFSESGLLFGKNRKITLIAGCAGLLVLIVAAILLFTTPVKAEFKFQDNASAAERYQVSRTDGMLIDAPKDPKRTCYDFGGWYLDAKFTKGGFFNNESDQSLLEYKFNTKVKIILYAKWTPTEYKVTYDVKGNANFSTQRVENLLEDNITKFGNPTTYTIKHTLSEYERNAYVEYLRARDPEKYVNSSNAEKNLSDALEFYANEQQKGTIKLNPLTMSGWTFIGWFDAEGNQVEELNRLSPKEITLTARWEQN